MKRQCSFPHRDVPVGAKNIPHRLRFTRALLESKDLSMRFSLPLCVWVSGIGPCSVETASEKRSPRTSYPPGWEAEFAGGGISKLPSAPVLWPPHAKSWLIGKDCDAGRDWGQEEKGTTEYEMAGWHHWLVGCESEWTPGVGDGQGGLACCDSWGRKESDTTERLN